MEQEKSIEHKQDNNLGILSPGVNEAYFALPEIIEYCKRSGLKVAELLIKKIEDQISASPYEMELIIKSHRDDALIRYEALTNSGLELNANMDLAGFQKVILQWMSENGTWRIPLAKGCIVDKNTSDCTAYIRSVIAPIFQSYYIIKECNKLLFLREDFFSREENPNYKPIASKPGKYFPINISTEIQFYIYFIIYLSNHNKKEMNQLFEDWFNYHLDKDWFVSELEKYVRNFYIDNTQWRHGVTNEEIDILKSIINKNKLIEETKNHSTISKDSMESFEDKIKRILGRTGKVFSNEAIIDEIIETFIAQKSNKPYAAPKEKSMVLVHLDEFIIPYKQLFDEDLFKRWQIAQTLAPFIARDAEKKTTYSQKYFEKLLSKCKIKAI